MKKIIFGLIVLVGLIVSLPIILILKIIKKEEYFNNLFLRPFFKILFKALNVKLNIIGEIKYPLQKTLVVANHFSLMDILALMIVFDEPLIFISKIENSKIPIISLWMNMNKTIYIDRNNIRKSISSLGEASKRIKENKAVMIFPQGTREVKNIHFKTGSLKIVQKVKGNILPIGLKGTDKILKGISYKKDIVDVYINNTIYYEDYEQKQLKDVQREIENLIKSEVLDD